jgi:membrane protease YdiL (CAAX protease family)
VEALRLLAPLFLALIATLAVDQLTRARGLDPPGFADPWRRAMGLASLGAAIWLGVFLALGHVGLPVAPPPQQIAVPELFVLHAIFLLAATAWFLFGYAGYLPPEAPVAGVFGRQLGLHAQRPGRELAIGLGLGLLVWPLLLVAMLLAMLLLVAFDQAVPQEPPALVVWLAGLPVPVKLLLALSAGFVEELFFRGLLQPRVGIGLSTLLFVLAHLSYDQPFMLVGVTLLSLFFAALVLWRQSVWAAVAAHTLFDAVQLLFVIPWALREWSAQSAAGVAVLL